MPITSLERSAFVTSQEFQKQVNDVVVRESMYKYDTIPDLDAVQQDALQRVINRPHDFAFVNTITSDVGWSLKYDEWAADPNAQDGAISAAVNKWFKLLTGFDPTPVTEPPVTP